MNEVLENLCPHCDHDFVDHGAELIFGNEFDLQCYGWVDIDYSKRPVLCGCLYLKDEYE